MNKYILRVTLAVAFILSIAIGGSAQYSKTIKLEYAAGFDTPFNTGGEWESVDKSAVKSTILSRVSTDFSRLGISVSETSGNMIVKIGVTGSGFGLAISGIGSFVSESNVTAEVYSNSFSNDTTWQDNNATVARIAEAIAGTASHEVAHLLNCYHAYASHTFDPAISNHLDGYHYPKEPEGLEGTTGDDYEYKYLNLLATRGWISLSQRATINRGWSNSSDMVIDFGTSGGSSPQYNAVWGIYNKSWTQVNNITVNSGKTMLIGAPSYTHNLNSKYIKAVGTGEIVYYSGLSGSYWQTTNTANTELYGLYPTLSSAISNLGTNQVVRNSSDQQVYPPIVTVSGDDPVFEYATGSWSVTVSGGTSPFSYQWIYKEAGETEWEYGGTSSSYSRSVGPAGTFLVKCEVTDTNSGTGEDTFSVTVPEEGEIGKVGEVILPTEFAIAQNYPNPFNPVTSIRYALPESEHVTLRVYNITGQLVAELVNESKSAGFHDVQWDASNMASGVYIYTISAGSFSETKKMVVMK